jgi:hypothetical protein
MDNVVVGEDIGMPERVEPDPANPWLEGHTSELGFENFASLGVGINELSKRTGCLFETIPSNISSRFIRQFPD